MPQVLLHCYQHQTWFLLLGTVFKIWKFPTWPVSLIPKSFVAQINWTMTREQHACHGIRWARFETVGWRWHRPSGAIHKSWSVQFATDVRPLAKGTLRGGFTTKMRDEGKKKTVGSFLSTAIASTSSSNAMNTTLQNLYTSEAHFVATGSVKFAIICTVTVRIIALKVANEFQDRWLMHARSLGRTGSTCFGIWFHIPTKETRTRIAFLSQTYFLVFIILQV